MPLGNVISYKKEFVQVDDTKTYKRCPVKLHAQGIILRDIVKGAEIKTKKQQAIASLIHLKPPSNLGLMPGDRIF